MNAGRDKKENFSMKIAFQKGSWKKKDQRLGKGETILPASLAGAREKGVKRAAQGKES